MIDHELTIGYYSDEFLSLQGPQGIQLLSNEEIWMFSLETNLNSATFHDIPWHLMIALGAYWFLALLIMLEMPPSGILPGTDPPPSDICSGPVIRWMSLKWDVKYLYTIYVTTPISNPKSTWLNWLNVPMLPSRLIPQSHPITRSWRWPSPTSSPKCLAPPSFWWRWCPRPRWSQRTLTLDVMIAQFILLFIWVVWICWKW